MKKLRPCLRCDKKIMSTPSIRICANCKWGGGYTNPYSYLRWNSCHIGCSSVEITNSVTGKKWGT